MNKKICIKCNLEKDISDFPIYKRTEEKIYRLNYCKNCKNEQLREWKKKPNSPRIYPGSVKEIILENGDKIKVKLCSKCKQIKNISEYNFSKDTKDSVKSCCKQCMAIQRRSDKCKRQRTEWRKNNKDKVKEHRKRESEKIKKDPNKKIKQIWRNLVRRLVVGCQYTKRDSTIEILGYSSEDLKKHIESLWTPEMSWENYGEWHIDHIKPLSSFNIDADPKEVNALSNLRPLWKTSRTINGVFYEGNLEKGDSNIESINIGCRKIKFGDFKLSKRTKRWINKYLDRDWLTMGVFTKRLEKKWSKLFDCSFSKLMSSGTSALIASLITLYDFGASQNDEIITSALSFIATSNAIRAAGFKPIFIDIDIDTLNIKVNEIEGRITDKTRAICVPNLMGRPCELDKIQEICKKYNLKFICDNCEAYGSKFNGKYSLNYSDIEITSHFAAHIIMMGEAGFLNTNNEQIDFSAASIRSHGRNPNSQYFEHNRFGLNLKPMDFQAVIGLGEISRFDRIFNKRKRNLNELIEYSQQYNHLAYFNLPDDEKFYSAPHAFSITLKDNNKNCIDNLKYLLDINNIEWKRNFGSIPTQQKCFEYLGYKLGDFPNAEYVGNYGIHLPVHQYLKRNDMLRIKQTLDKFFHPLHSKHIFPLIQNNAVDDIMTKFNEQSSFQI